ncbi:MAG: hypothetical protein JST92_20260 [Deltaproteobacteria bacterium]|nr:hypothetical protein [Deltaproteobacteria bacterium]
MPMKKTQVYFRPDDLRALHRVAKERKRPVAELIREAVQEKWLGPATDARPGHALIGLYKGPLPKGFSSDDHDAAFDEP